VLRELADRGTIAATAEALGYTPPAVSQQLAALEKEAGVALLEPNGRGRRLTDAGRELVARTEAILREIEVAEAALERSQTTVSGTLRTASFSSALREVLVPAVARTMAQHPGLTVVSEELEPEDSLPMLKRRELDLVLAQEYPFAPVSPDPALERVELLGDPVKLALPADRDVGKGPVDLRTLADEPWVAGRDGTWCHAVVLHAARAAGFEPRLAHRTNDFSVSYSLVSRGLGAALIPSLAGPPPQAVRLHEIDGQELQRRIYAAVRAGSAERPAIAALLESLSACRVGRRGPSASASRG
jgi:DNA-binding transcriptional LysR family regulator